MKEAQTQEILNDVNMPRVMTQIVDRFLVNPSGESGPFFWKTQKQSTPKP